MEKAFFHSLKSHHKILFSVIGAFALILFWRGVWGLADEFIFPGQPMLSYSSSAVIGFVILVATGLAIKELS